jgi:hypothetical protein
VWLLDPKPRVLEVFRLESTGYQLLATYEGGGPVRAQPFEAIELELAFLWDER